MGVSFVYKEVMNQKALDALITRIVKISEIAIPRDASAVGLSSLRECLVAANEKRQELTRIHSRILVRTKMLDARVRELDATWKIKVDDALVNDSEVKAASNADARLARARARFVADRREIGNERERLAMWKAIEEVCISCSENLKIAKESISRMIAIYELEMQKGVGDFLKGGK